MPAKSASRAGTLTEFNETKENKPSIRERRPRPTRTGWGHNTKPHAIAIAPLAAAIISQFKRHLRFFERQVECSNLKSRAGVPDSRSAYCG
jgi:hypothetical protein